MSDDKYLAKVAALLRQAESTENENEAAAFMAAAQRLATVNAIDLAMARSHQADKEKRESPIQKQIIIGDSSKRGLKYYVQLFLEIAKRNDVKCDIAHNSTYVIAFGFPSDIAMVETLYASLVVQMIEASDRFLRSGEYKKELIQVEVYEKVYDSWAGRNVREFSGFKTKPVDGRVARANFQQGFISRISTRLFEARQQAIDEAKANEPTPVIETESTGTELVLANKAVELHNFHKSASKARGSWSGSRGSSYSSSTSRQAGNDAGARARLGGERAITTGQRQI